MDLEFSWNGNQKFQLMVSLTHDCCKVNSSCRVNSLHPVPRWYIPWPWMPSVGLIYQSACTEASGSKHSSCASECELPWQVRLILCESLTDRQGCCSTAASVHAAGCANCNGSSPSLTDLPIPKLDSCADKSFAQSASAAGHRPHDCPVLGHAGGSVRSVYSRAPAHHVEAAHGPDACSGSHQGSGSSLHACHPPTTTLSGSPSGCLNISRKDPQKLVYLKVPTLAPLLVPNCQEPSPG